MAAVLFFFEIDKMFQEVSKTSKTIIQIQASWVFVVPAETIEKNSKNVCTIRSFVRSLVRSKFFQILVRADAIDLVQKSSNFEPSSPFFGRLKILNSKRRRNEAFEFDSSCRAPQRFVSTPFRIQNLQTAEQSRGWLEI